MAFLFGCENVHLEYPTKTIFDSLSLGVNDGDCIGVVGRNGDGKSTLLGLFEGTVKPDEGRVVRTGGVRFASLRQDDTLADAQSVGWNIVGDVPEYEWASDATIRQIIDGLIGDIAWDTPVGTLSGGQRRRVDLARVLVADAEVLLLDEPTNHLDVVAITWLANHLRRRFARKEGAMVVVTHDRWFLDEVCDRMWEVHDELVEPFEGGYSAYILQRVERQRQAELAEQKRQNLMRRELAWLSRGARARSTKPKFHVETARALIAEEPPLRNSVELKRAAISRLGKQCVTVENVSFSYDDRKVIDDATWLIGPGDRYGLLGANGAGKSTLLEIIQGKLLPQTGRVKIGKTVKFAFLSQKLEELNPLGSDRVREVLSRYKSRYVIDGKEVSPATLLESLGFTSAHLNMPVNTLSGGQKRRLQLMLILLDSPNVLILDEPSNDLDTDMLVAVENVLDTWPGTLILVSHDRYLMERVTDDQFALIEGKVVHVPRGVDEYLELLEDRAQAKQNGGSSSAAGSSSKGSGKGNTVGKGSVQSGGTRDASSGAKDSSGSVLSAAQARDIRKKLQSLERKMNTAQRKVDEAKQAQLEVDPYDYVALGEAQIKVKECEDRLSALEEEWLEQAAMLEG
ncbi:MAG: ABC-F family ATP-binding cassette domain-containing protein [Eggerthellaceae bacterium]|nr:ABC-F family ATP-binding cassette domain-containing protein [Eggerthellaceae bacterium]